MDYATLDELLAAGTTNMSVLRNNTAQDDGTDTIVGVDWFTFKGVVSTSIYASGNSYIGFGETSAGLNVNQQDAKMYYLYREEGVVSGVRFLKVRWRGYSRYSSTSSSYLMEYDVIIFDNGVIFLNMVSIPSSYASGTYSLVADKTYSYTVNSSQKQVSFTPNDASGYVVSYGYPILALQRYLVRVGSDIYTKGDEGLINLGSVTLTAELLENQGSISNFTSDELKTFTNPEVLYWSSIDLGKEISAKVVARPKEDQYIITNEIMLTDETIIGLGTATVDCDGDLILAVSKDKVTWLGCNASGWYEITDQFGGMSKEEVEAITSDQWGLLYNQSQQLYFRVSLVNISQAIRQVYLQFLN